MQLFNDQIQHDKCSSSIGKTAVPLFFFQAIAGACSVSNCSMNEKCIPKPFEQFECVLSGYPFIIIIVSSIISLIMFLNKSISST